MSDETRLKELISQGKNADAWLNHPTFKHVVTLRKAQLIEAFEKTKFQDEAERTEIWRKIQCLNTLVGDFERIIRNGKDADKTLLQRLKEKVSR